MRRGHSGHEKGRIHLRREVWPWIRRLAAGTVARAGALPPRCAWKAEVSDFRSALSETDVVLLVMNDGGMKHLFSDKFTIGGEATAAAGPIGRDASAQTDAMLNAEMLSYSRSRGLVCRHLAGRRDASSG